MKRGERKKTGRGPRKNRERKQKRVGVVGVGGGEEPGEASREECRPWRGPGTKPGCGPGKPGTPRSPVPEEASAARHRPPPAHRIWARLPVRRGRPGSSGLRSPFLSQLPGDHEAGRKGGRGCPKGREPVRDCLGALGQAFQLAGPDLSGGLSSREINRGGGLQ